MPRDYFESWMRCTIADYRRSNRGGFGRAAVAARARVLELSRAVDDGPAARFDAAWDRVYRVDTDAQRREAMAEATEAHTATIDATAELYAAAVAWDAACPASRPLAGLVECLAGLFTGCQAAYLDGAPETLAALDRRHPEPRPC
jgi:hypothetical protein